MGFKESAASGKMIAEERKRWGFLGLPLTFTKFYLTEKKLVVYSGLLTTTEDEILLYRVLDISRKRNLFQKMFGLGTILVTSQDKTLPELEIKNIKNSDEFKNLLSEQVEAEKKRMNVRAGEYMGIGGHHHPVDLDHDGIPDPPPHEFEDGY